MMQRDDLARYLDQLLEVPRFRDYCPNGLQVEGRAGVSRLVTGVSASQALIDANPKAVAGFLRAFTRGAKEVIADPDAAIKFVKDREPLIDVEVEKRRLRLALQVSIATPTAKANGIGGAEKANIDRMVREIVSAFGLKQSPNPDLMFNAGFMPPKPERMIFTK